MLKDTVFYNKESGVYSLKRYPSTSTEFSHFLFKDRLRLTLRLLTPLVAKVDGATLLEIGCADGVVISAIYKTFPSLRVLVGEDVSPKMIEVARNNHRADHINFRLRDDSLNQTKKYDFIIEIGVMNYTDINKDLLNIKNKLSASGYAILSIVGKDSISNRLKPGEKGFANLMPYAQYRDLIKDKFEIIDMVSVGLFVPHLWKVPVLARLVQPVIDFLFRRVWPDLFHEQLYLVRNR